jgi:hypothetical protein
VIYTSPYTRAVDTVTPFAQGAGLRIERVEGLFDKWAAMRNPDIFRIYYHGLEPVWDQAFTLAVSSSTAGSGIEIHGSRFGEENSGL